LWRGGEDVSRYADILRHLLGHGIEVFCLASCFPPSFDQMPFKLVFHRDVGAEI